MKKFGALLLAIVMVLSLTGVAGAASAPVDLTDGEVGGFGSPDTTNVSSKAIKIAKEITVFNVDETEVMAPTISYTYTITSGEPGKSITDQTTDHDPEGAVTRTTFAGVTDGVSLGDTNGVVAWTAENKLTADPDGAPNYKYLTIDFTNVKFGKPGVYRYVINEALTSGTYAQAGVTENEVKTNPVTHTHTRYLDVYVKSAKNANFVDGDKASNWEIYGYVCMIDNDDITPDGDTTSLGALKTNGFVQATNDSIETTADRYYTFNVTISKELVGDAYSNNHEFPVHVDYTNDAVTQDVLLIAKKTGTATDYAHTAVAVNSLDGLAKIANGGSIKYIGIPCGTTVAVYETNDVAGTTYETTLTVDGTAGATKSIVSTGTPGAFATYAEQSYNSLKGEITTTADERDSETGLHTVAIKNEFSLISPTGVVLRIAPYALILGAGILLLLISRRRNALVEEE